MLFAGVRIRSKDVDPINPERWEMKRFHNHPYNNFTRFILPRLIIFGYGDDECWCVDCRTRDRIDNWDPEIRASWNWQDEAPVFKTWGCRQLVGRVFYDFPDGNDWCVYRDKDICSQPNCVRPTHLIPAPRNNTRAKYGSAKLPTP
jgi:hypothetical protein